MTQLNDGKPRQIKVTGRLSHAGEDEVGQSSFLKLVGFGVPGFQGGWCKKLISRL